MWTIVVLLLLLLTFYKFFTANYDYWRKKGVPHPPISILFGNMKDSIFVRKSIGKLYADLYKEYSHLSYLGFYKIRQPAILVRDPAIVKQVLVTEFSSFHDNDMYVDENTDPIFGKNPFTLTGERWKTSRNQLAVCFTTKRLKSMFVLMEKVGQDLVKYLNGEIQKNHEDGFDAKELAAKFTIDVFASCAFGLEGHSFDDPKAEFREIGRKLLTPSLSLALKHFVVMFLPVLSGILKIRFFPKEVVDYLRIIVNKTIKYRKENNVVRGDFLDMMLNFKNKLGENEFNDEDILIHTGGFFGDGYETSSIALSYALFELAANPEKQIKLRNEIEDMFAKNEGSFTYEAMIEMKYLDQVLNESLRKNPPAPQMLKVCTKRFILPSPYGIGKGPDVIVEPGTPIYISIYGIHHDEEHYFDPETFEPERFSAENSNAKKDCTFLPFGDGPRICLGQKFGITQVKVAIVSMIANFEIRVNKRTRVPLEIDPQYFLLKAKGDIWLDFKSICSSGL